MTKRRFLLDVRPRDADAPGFYDLRLDADQLMREFRGEPCLDRLCRKVGMTRGEVLKTFTPAAYADPATGEVVINAGYDPRFDEGVLKAMIWNVVNREVSHALAGSLPQTGHVRTRSEPGADNKRHTGHDLDDGSRKTNTG